MSILPDVRHQINGNFQNVPLSLFDNNASNNEAFTIYNSENGRLYANFIIIFSIDANLNSLKKNIVLTLIRSNLTFNLIIFYDVGKIDCALFGWQSRFRGG